MLQIKDYDNVELVAADTKGNCLYIGDWGKRKSSRNKDIPNTRYIIVVPNEEPAMVGQLFNTRQAYIDNAYQYAKEQWSFVESDILHDYERIKTVKVTKAQLVAINTAISILGDSVSDHAEQAVCHLKKLSKTIGSLE